MKVEVAVLVSPSLTVRTVPAVDVKQHFQEVQYSEFRICVKVEMAVPGSPSLTVRKVPAVDVRQH